MMVCMWVSGIRLRGSRVLERRALGKKFGLRASGLKGLRVSGFKGLSVQGFKGLGA